MTSRTHAPRRTWPVWAGPEALEARIAPAVLTVTTGADSGPGSLRAAIEVANASAEPDILHFERVTKIKLATALPTITGDLIFAALNMLTIDGLKKTQLISIAGDGVDVTFQRMKFVNGSAEAGAALQINAPNGTVIVRNCSFSGNVANEDEAGAPAIGVGPARGGAIVHEAGRLTIETSTFTNNRVVSLEDVGEGGAIYNAGALEITGSTFSKNRVLAFEADGGAIYNHLSGTLKLVRSKVTGNLAQGTTGVAGADGANGDRATDPGEDGGEGEPGGGGYDGGAARGGGVANLGAASLEESSVSKNRALGGAGGKGGKGGKGGAGGPREPGYTSYGYTTPGTPAGHKGTGGDGGLGGNGGVTEGGGIWNGAGTLTIEHSTVDGNAAVAGARGKGGAPGLGFGRAAAGPPGLTGDESAGGGIWNHGTLKVLAQSSVSKNLAQGLNARGGGIASFETAVAEISEAVVAKNCALAAKGNDGLAGGAGRVGERGAPGEDGGEGEAGGDGGNGEAGGDSLGGGIYNAGVLTLSKATLSGNLAKAGAGGKGGKGGTGGAGGAGGRKTRDEGEVIPAGQRGAGGTGGSGGSAGDAGSAQGGGIYNTRLLFDLEGTQTFSAGEATIDASRIEKNTTASAPPGKLGKGGAAGRGGGGAAKGADGFEGELSQSDGGGLYSVTGKLTISGVTSFTKNKAGGSGGGLSIIENLATLITGATITKNSAKIKGGGIFVVLNAASDPVRVIGAAITANRALIDPDTSGPIETAAPA